MLGEQEFEKGEETTLKETKHELIIANCQLRIQYAGDACGRRRRSHRGTVFHGKVSE